MKEIDIKENKVFLAVNKDLYSSEALETTLKTFRENFDVEVGGEDQIIVEIRSQQNVDEEKLSMEFLNFLLSQEKAELASI